MERKKKGKKGVGDGDLNKISGRLLPCNSGIPAPSVSKLQSASVGAQNDLSHAKPTTAKHLTNKLKLQEKKISLSLLLPG